MIYLERVNNNELYWEYIRVLRNDPSVSQGFIQEANITSDQQKIYMKKHGHNYFIVKLGDENIGFIGDVNEDIRICIHPDYQNRGYGTKAIMEFYKLFPKSQAKIKIGNQQSIKAFENAGYKIKYLLLEK